MEGIEAEIFWQGMESGSYVKFARKITLDLLNAELIWITTRIHELQFQYELEELARSDDSDSE